MIKLEQGTNYSTLNGALSPPAGCLVGGRFFPSVFFPSSFNALHQQHLCAKSPFSVESFRLDEENDKKRNSCRLEVDPVRELSNHSNPADTPQPTTILTPLESLLWEPIDLLAQGAWVIPPGAADASA